MEQEEHSPKKRAKKIAIFLLKVAVSVLAFWYVSTKVDLTRSLELLTTVDPLFLILGILVFNFSKIISTWRILALLKSLGQKIGIWENIRIYYIGAFYNIFLPGSMGGDAYKVFLLKQRTGEGYRKMTSTVFLDRGSGMAMLVIITILMFPLSTFGQLVPQPWLVAISAIVLLLVGFFVFVKLFFKHFISAFLAINIYSLATQLTQVLTAWLLMNALYIKTEVIDHLVLFMVSGVVSVVPITVGGFGAREITFQWGTKVSNIDLESAVAFTLLFFLVTLISSVVGSVFVFGRSRQRV